MGAFDIYYATVRCPRCGAWHWLDGQTRFFAPMFHSFHSREFRPGEPRPLDFAPERLRHERVWEEEWVRIAEPGDDPSALRLLADFDELFACSCGVGLAMVLRFRLEAGPGASGTATLVEVELLDALDDERAAAADFANGLDVAWGGPWRSHAELVEALPAASAAERAGWLREALAFRFEPWQDEVDDGSGDGFTWTRVVGPMRCEACGDVRERNVHAHFTGHQWPRAFLGPGWRGGVMRLGARVGGDFGWLDEDVERGYHVRLRHPVPAPGFVVTDGPQPWGCACGAGRAAVILRFARGAEGVTLASASLRVLRTREDVADIDFGYSGEFSRDIPARPGSGVRPATREEAVARLLDWRWGLAP